MPEPYDAGDVYIYEEIKDVVNKREAEKANFYAVVVDCTHPRRTKGEDYSCTLMLVDPSTKSNPDLQQGVQLVCFAKHPENLPRMQHIGDIIRLHRVVVQHYHGRPQLVAKLHGRYGAPASLCMFHLAGDSDVPYHSSSPKYSFNNRDSVIINHLRKLQRSIMPGPNQLLHRIKDVHEPHHYFDLICKVVGRTNIEPGKTPVLFVWDATDAAPLFGGMTVGMEVGAPDQQQEPPPLALVPLSIPMANMPVNELHVLPTIGTFLPVMFHDGSLMEDLPEIGSWVKLRNICSVAADGQLQAKYFSKSKWSPWEPDTACEEEYNQRKQQNLVDSWGYRFPDQWGSTTVHATQPFTTLRQVLMDTPLGQPMCYRCLVRVYDYSPRTSAEVCHNAAECGYTGDPDAWVYTVRLHVEDATGRLDVNLTGPSATAFFHNLPPCDLSGDPDAGHQMMSLLDSLVSHQDGNNNEGTGPWLDVTIQSYYLDPEAEAVWESRRYMLTDTKLKY